MTKTLAFVSVSIAAIFGIAVYKKIEMEKDCRCNNSGNCPCKGSGGLTTTSDDKDNLPSVGVVVNGMAGQGGVSGGNRNVAEMELQRPRGLKIVTAYGEMQGATDDLFGGSVKVLPLQSEGGKMVRENKIYSAFGKAGMVKNIQPVNDGSARPSIVDPHKDTVLSQPANGTKAIVNNSMSNVRVSDPDTFGVNDEIPVDRYSFGQ